ncbi:hypothetical protein HYX18_04410 [Candidatus Woesearchaeota archaeon]|nr:hypothetical protein [Candidatus Woesearchaeota archaeon]
MNREGLIETIKNFHDEIYRENYSHLIGLKEDLNETKIYSKYQYLFTKENIKFLKDLVAKSTALEKRKNNYLIGYVIGNFVGQKLSKISDEAAAFEAKAFVEFKGNKIPYRGLTKIMNNEDNKENRDLLYEAQKPIKLKLLDYNIKYLKQELKLLNDLGYKSYIELNSAIKEVDYFKLRDELKAFLVETDEKFTVLIHEAMKSINVNTDDARNYDWGYYARHKEFDGAFPKENVISTLKKTLLGIGFNLDIQKNIELDIEEREKKVPRAFMMPIKVPDEIKLVIKPNGGYEDYNAILHEAGHAEHYAHVNPDLDYEFKHFGDHSVTEIFSFLFDNLMQDPNWLKIHTRMNNQEIEKFVKENYLQDLFMFRRYIAKLIYELKLFSDDLRKLDSNFNPAKGYYKNFGECYSDILSKATKVKYPKSSYLIDLDGGFYVADYLRAWIGERQLRHKLKQDYGTEWFKNKKAGEFLKKLYSLGNSKHINELMQESGFKGLDTIYIFRDFKDFLDKA